MLAGKRSGIGHPRELVGMSAPNESWPCGHTAFYTPDKFKGAFPPRRACGVCDKEVWPFAGYPPPSQQGTFAQVREVHVDKGAPEGDVTVMFMQRIDKSQERFYRPDPKNPMFGPLPRPKTPEIPAGMTLVDTDYLNRLRDQSQLSTSYQRQAEALQKENEKLKADLVALEERRKKLDTWLDCMDAAADGAGQVTPLKEGDYGYCRGYKKVVKLYAALKVELSKPDAVNMWRSRAEKANLDYAELKDRTRILGDRNKMLSDQLDTVGAALDGTGQASPLTQRDGNWSWVYQKALELYSQYKAALLTPETASLWRKKAEEEEHKVAMLQDRLKDAECLVNEWKHASEVANRARAIAEERVAYAVEGLNAIRRITDPSTPCGNTVGGHLIDDQAKQTLGCVTKAAKSYTPTPVGEELERLKKDKVVCLDRAWELAGQVCVLYNGLMEIQAHPLYLRGSSGHVRADMIPLFNKIQALLKQIDSMDMIALNRRVAQYGTDWKRWPSIPVPEGWSNERLAEVIHQALVACVEGPAKN